MATTPPTELPQPTSPGQPDAPPPEIVPPGPDIDTPAPGAPSEDPAPGNPSMADTRSDIEQAVEARSDAVDRGEGGVTLNPSGTAVGSDGIVRNQEGDGQ